MELGNHTVIKQKIELQYGSDRFTCFELLIAGL